MIPWQKGDWLICTQHYLMEERLTEGRRYRVELPSITRFIQIVDDKGELHGFAKNRFQRVTQLTDDGAEEYDEISRAEALMEKMQ